MDVLLITAGLVENCICADSTERAAAFYPGHTCIERTPALAHVGPGHTYDAATGQFTAPPPVPVPAPPPAPMSRLEFMRRIPAAARINIRATAQVDPVIADALALLDAAQDVDPADPDTVAFVMYLRSLHLLTDEQAVALVGS
ncbi:MAG: hypothetical protein RLY71_438 [Pseudomonadota bacterium]|jgi:hypothetical protein